LSCRLLVGRKNSKPTKTRPQDFLLPEHPSLQALYNTLTYRRESSEKKKSRSDEKEKKKQKQNGKKDPEPEDDEASADKQAAERLKHQSSQARGFLLLFSFIACFLSPLVCYCLLFRKSRKWHRRSSQKSSRRRRG
jgi:hypothetical protein